MNDLIKRLEEITLEVELNPRNGADKLRALVAELNVGPQDPIVETPKLGRILKRVKKGKAKLGRILKRVKKGKA